MEGFKNFLDLLADNNYWTLIVGGLFYMIYNKREEIYKLVFGIVETKYLITDAELLNHTLFVHIKYNMANNVFQKITEKSNIFDFKYYIANALNYIIQHTYYHIFLDLTKRKNEAKTDKDFEDMVRHSLKKAETIIKKQITTNYNEALYELFDEKTSVILDFYHSLVLSVLQYEQINRNTKMYIILNTLVFVTKTNQNSLFSLILSLNGKLEAMKGILECPTKLELENIN